jgi:hypothetical protein
MRINTSKVCLVKCSFGGCELLLIAPFFFLVSSTIKIVIVIHCMIHLCNVCHNKLFLPNLWKCRYHFYWNLSYPLSILKVIFSKSNKLWLKGRHCRDESCNEWRLLFWWQLSQCEIAPIWPLQKYVHFKYTYCGILSTCHNYKKFYYRWLNSLSW